MLVGQMARGSPFFRLLLAWLWCFVRTYSSIHTVEGDTPRSEDSQYSVDKVVIIVQYRGREPILRNSHSFYYVLPPDPGTCDRAESHYPVAYKDWIVLYCVRLMAQLVAAFRLNVVRFGLGVG